MNDPVIIPKALNDKLSLYCSRMHKLCGYNPIMRDRHRAYVTPRSMVAYKLLNEGYTEHQVAEALRMEHSTIHFYRKKVSDMLSTRGYETERELWKAFNEYDAQQIV